MDMEHLLLKRMFFLKSGILRQADLREHALQDLQAGTPGYTVTRPQVLQYP